ncbi:MAG: dephospho-CoA kinase, partial [Sedimenticolaceae bacterium]
MLKIGLTGGIGSGKTTAGDYFAEFGAEVIDTDLLSRELVEPGQPALAEIVAAFGAEVLDGAG